LSIRTSRSSKRLIAAAVAVAVTASTFAISNNAGAAGTTIAPEGSRISGADRYATAGAIALKAASLGNTCDIVIANGNSFADGLAAAGLAYEEDAVILLTEANSVPASTVTTIETLAKPCNNGTVAVNIVGGTSAVSQSVFETLSSHVSVSAVTRFGGADRYATSLAVAKKVVNTSVIIVTGRNFPDALAAGPLAYEMGAPIILHDGSTPSAEIVAFLVAEGVTSATIVGGTAVVPQSIQDALVDALGITVTRVAGADRFATAVSVAGELNKLSTNAYKAGVILANGRNFPDALAAAPLAASVSASVLLVESGSIPAATAEWHVANSDTLANVWAVGGTAVVADAVLTGAVAAAKAVAPALTSATVAYKQTAAVLGLAGVATLSATAAPSVAGAIGNDWVVTLSTSTDPTKVGVSVDSGDKTIEVTANFEGLTAAQFIALWDASDAAKALFTVASNNGTFAAADAGTYSSTNGATETTVELTFNRTVASVDVTKIGVFATANIALTTPVFATPALGTTGDRTQVLTGDLKVVIVDTTNDSAEVTALGTAEVRLAAAAVESKVGAIANVAGKLRLTAA
jgi:putative cell wall-binding protein